MPREGLPDGCLAFCGNLGNTIVPRALRRLFIPQWPTGFSPIPTALTWLVLAVYPHVEERRSERDRRTQELPVQIDHRERERRVNVRRGMEQGWLVFKTDNGRRRLAPIVEGWDSFTDEELDRLCRRATPARRLSDPKPREASRF